jgi:adenosine deaminase
MSHHLPATIKHIPKVELHLHLGGAYPLSYLQQISTEEEFIQVKNSLKAYSNRLDYHEGFKVFESIAKLVNNEEKIQGATAALCRDFIADGVVYAEIRTGLKDFGNGYEAYLKAVLRGINEVSSGYGSLIKLLLSVRRNTPPDLVKHTIDLAIQYKSQGVVGIDVSGDESLGSLSALLPELRRAQEHELGLTVHIGETPGVEESNLECLQQIKVGRIGHGVLTNRATQEYLFQNRIPIEVCLSSNVLASIVEHIDAHPIRDWWEGKYAIAICTDDPLIFSSNLSDELLLFSRLCSVSVDALVQLQKEAITYSFASEEEKKYLLEKYFA